MKDIRDSVIEALNEQLNRPNVKEINGHFIIKIQNGKAVCCEFKLEIEGKKDLT